MENKLQELTDKLYREGLSKGKEEGEALLAKAEEKAAEIIEAARVKAEEIIKQAEKDAADFRTKVEGDVKMASMQSLQATRNTIENLMVEGLVGKQTSSALSSPDFVKEIILAVGRLRWADSVLYEADEVASSKGYSPFSAGIGLVQEGLYLYRHMGIRGEHGPLYERAGIRYYPPSLDPFFVSVCIKAHKFKADYLDFSIGIRL